MLTKYPWYVRLIFWLQKKHYGAVLNSATLWAKSPKLFLALSLFYGMLDRKNSPISPALRSLVLVRISQINGCAFCIDLNTSVLLSRGISIEKALALAHWRTSELFTEQEKITLAYAEAVTDSSKAISPQIQNDLKSIFNETDRVELTALIAFQNMSTKFNNAFGVDSQGFCTIPMHKE